MTNKNNNAFVSSVLNKEEIVKIAKDLVGKKLIRHQFSSCLPDIFDFFDQEKKAQITGLHNPCKGTYVLCYKGTPIADIEVSYEDLKVYSMILDKIKIVNYYLVDKKVEQGKEGK